MAEAFRLAAGLATLLRMLPMPESSASLAVLGLGFVLGMRHATDPDHVIAVSTIVTRERSVVRAGMIGVLWGCGHTVTILIVGAAIILRGLAIPTRVGLTMEFSVGLMLILLGILNLSGALSRMAEKFSPAHPAVQGEHAHVHRHGNQVHFHWHRHGEQREEHHGITLQLPKRVRAALQRLGVFHTLRALLVGVVHGLAGSAAVALLVLGTIHEAKRAVVYLAVVGVGTIAGMMLITAALSLPFSVARFAGVNRGLVTASGVMSLAFGLFVAYQAGFVGGLFTGHPVWVPR